MLDDVTHAVLECTEIDQTIVGSYEFIEAESRTLEVVFTAIRYWLELISAVFNLNIPAPFA